jgi:putative nucleotidyltransferase with HDIG domain
VTTTFTFPGTPEPPAWRLEFDALVHRFPWLAALAACPQEPDWHAEGDVLTHTRMVVDRLVAMPAWRALTPAERTMTFAAAVLHDVGKPATTKMEDGRLRSKGHGRVGAHLARRIFMTDFPAAPFALREQVVALVRHHGVPAYFLDRDDPARHLLAASMSTRTDLLFLVAAADALGRETRGRNDMPARTDLFREFAQEHGCWPGAYPFADAHSRFMYFRTPGAPPTAVRFDDCACDVVVMSGLPAAGKDSWISRHAANWPVVSLDAWREALGVDPGGDQGPVIDAAKAEAKGLLRKKRSFIWNATNTTRFLRDPLIALLAGYRARVRIVYREVPLAELRARNARRPAPVPEHVYETLLSKLDVPDLTEAHAVDWPAEWV